MEALKTYYSKPTHIKWKKWGDAILATSTFVTGGSLLAFEQLESIFSKGEVKVIIGIAIGLGVLGKFATNFFKEDSAQPANEAEQK